MDRKTFLLQSALAAAGALVYGPASAMRSSPQLVLGHGDHRYRLREDWSNASSKGVSIKDAHEMVQSKDGRLFLITNETRNNILIFDSSGKLLDSWGNSFPGGHGLTISEEGGTEYLYITDYELHKVFKTTLDGRVLLTLEAPIISEKYQAADHFKPTETAIGPDGSIYVADGYGAQWISVFDAKGRFQRCFGGPKYFNNAHGICIDQRGSKPTLLITARDQNKLKRFSLDGQWMADYHFPGAFLNRAVVRGDYTYVSVLKSGAYPNRPSGFVMVLDAENKLVSCPGGSDPSSLTERQIPIHQTLEVFQHPHDVCVDANENLYIPQWNSGGVFPILLERV